MNTSVYLVMEPIGIIASDLAMNVQDYDPMATVLVALSPEAGCVMLVAICPCGWLLFILTQLVLLRHALRGCLLNGGQRWPLPGTAQNATTRMHWCCTGRFPPIRQLPCCSVPYGRKPFSARKGCRALLPGVDPYQSRRLTTLSANELTSA